jgi:hypothetical protein
MIPNLISTAVDESELLARFIFSRSHIRTSDSTLKPDAFIPPINLELSVTRHIGLSVEEIWLAGTNARPSITLYGRADLQAIDARNTSLQVSSDPPPKNHAIITGCRERNLHRK